MSSGRPPGRGCGRKRGRGAGVYQRNYQSEPRERNVTGRNGVASHRYRITFLSRNEIETLAQSDSEAVVRCINENEPGFLAAYGHDRYCTHPLLLKHLVMVLYKLATSNDEQLASRVLAQILSASGSYAQFIVQLDMLIKMMPAEGRTHIRRENLQYLHYIIEIGLFAIQRIPQSVVYTFPTESVRVTVDNLIKGGEQLAVLVPRVEKLTTEFASVVEELQNVQKQPKQSSTEANSMPDPPEHFTTLPVLPKIDEVQSYAQQSYLRPNIEKGGYNNWDHYLDVQFRLLREDFVAPLREGITQYCEGKKLSDVRVYEQVSVLQPVCLYSGMGFQIRFDVTKLKRVNWEHTKRLIYGSLLSLSHDDFETVIFATVVKRDAKLLQEGLITIKFEDETNGFQIDPSVVYTMVESNAYFEAYRHVLTGLQNASTNAVLPFKRYIVDCQHENVPLPSYLRSAGRPVFSLKDIIANENDPLSRNALSNVVLTSNFSEWPLCQQTRLDASQYEAFQVALTQEISVIQGPPGTGKTFIGLKIIEAFLRNRNVWDHLKTSPICVVCYTNHALDQFLEGIKDTKIDGKEPNIIRIGGRCKTESLKSCVLREKVDAIRARKALPRNLHKGLAVARNNLFKVKDDINRFQQSLEVSDGKVFGLSSLENVITPLHFSQFTDGIPIDPGKEVDVWLGLWYSQYSNEEPLSSTEPLDSPSIAYAQTQETAPQQKTVLDDDLIEVDAEARLLEEDRILEGEELELEPHANYSQHTKEQKKPVPQKSQSGWKTVQISDDRRRKLIREGYKQKPMEEREVHQVRDIWSLSKKQRWKLYNYWANKFVYYQKIRLARIGVQYNEACEDYRVCQREINNYVMRGADVIGITTTGAAKHQEMFKHICPKIVIIEEAAEVFEAHIVSSLAPSVQQLIMIGDHQQLRPKPNSYVLEKKYGLDISLFERLALNDFRVISLRVQHRMRPQVADLIRPCIYSNLVDHVTVTEYDDINGVGKSLFAIDHQMHEEPSGQNDLMSHANLHEAEYLVALCKYLLKQGYEHSQITLLTMYRGQLLELRRRMKRADFQGVRVAAVDDFQGEENDIILLSLVRSNSDGNIGFLRVKNRVCVSLSRAKKGLYIIGNFTMLRNKHDTVWPQILTTLERKQCIGNALPLYCQLHPSKKVAAQRPQDFLKCPEGGCQQPCATRLQCGHTCLKLCHPYDREHKKYKCRKPCGRTLSCGHQCKRMCHQCTDGCQLCNEEIRKKIPFCGHLVLMPCSADPACVDCTELCDKTLPCGHMCQETCSKPCTPKCFAKMDKNLECGHKVEEYCFINPKKIVCQNPCNALLTCDHRCSGSCGVCHGGRLHIRCKSKCDRTLVCGHLCEFPCTPNCPPCLQKCNNYCVHSKCPKRCYELCTPCMEPCEWKCMHLRCTRPCGELCNRLPCNQPCKKRLKKCGHPCIGLCGEICPKQCRICDENDVCEIFFGAEDEPDARFIQLHDCGHIFEVEGLDTWMECKNEDSPKEVQFKVCPKCKTEVHKSLRYGNAIKQTLLDHEEV